MEVPRHRRRYRYRYGPLTNTKRKKSRPMWLVLTGMLIAAAVVRSGGGGEFPGVAHLWGRTAQSISSHLLSP